MYPYSAGSVSPKFSRQQPLSTRSGTDGEDHASSGSPNPRSWQYGGPATAEIPHFGKFEPPASCSHISANFGPCCQNDRLPMGSTAHRIRRRPLPDANQAPAISIPQSHASLASPASHPRSLDHPKAAQYPFDNRSTLTGRRSSEESEYGAIPSESGPQHRPAQEPAQDVSIGMYYLPIRLEPQPSTPELPTPDRSEFADCVPWRPDDDLSPPPSPYRSTGGFSPAVRTTSAHPANHVREINPHMSFQDLDQGSRCDSSPSTTVHNGRTPSVEYQWQLRQTGTSAPGLTKNRSMVSRIMRKGRRLEVWAATKLAELGSARSYS